MIDSRQLASQYTTALGAYLEGAGEDALSRAYQLGREGLQGGLGLLDLSAIHHDAIRAVIPWSSPPDGQQLEQASLFFAETLSAFEMALRGYEDVNQKLQALNRKLERQNVELSHAKAAADAANSELEAFSYSVAHDLRAPLRSITGFSTALAESSSDRLDAQAKDHLDRVLAASARMSRLIDGLLELARLARKALKRSKVDVSALARAVIAQLRQSEPDRVIQCVVADGLVADADPELLQIVLENLIGNGWKFTSKKDGARLEIGPAPGGGFFVRDNGAGFDMAYASKLFAPFYRLHTTAEFPGTGIGLATVQRIIGHHGGYISAEATAGEGATFTVTLGESPR